METLKNNGIDEKLLKDVVEIPIYANNELTWETFFGSMIDEIKKQFPMLMYETTETIVKISDYNKIASLYRNANL